jgi:hypothetical protein
MFERLIDNFFKKMERDAEYEAFAEFEGLYDRNFEEPLSPCKALDEDLDDLLLAVSGLKKRLRETPLNKKSVSGALNNVKSASKAIQDNWKSRSYVKQGCTQGDKKFLALRVRSMLRNGKNLPQQARQNLQILLN